MLRWTRWTCCLCTEGQLVHTLPEGLPVRAVTSLGEEIYLLRRKEIDQVEVYDVISYRLLRCLTVPNIRGFYDMTSCEHFLCLYIADHFVKCIHRLDLQGKATVWPVNDRPTGLSVNTDHNLIVTCNKVRKIKEFSPRGDLLRQFIVCHGGPNDPIHRVCKISSDDCNVVQSHGGQPGSNIGQYNGPVHLAVDDNEFVFVVDINNRRVTSLSPTLDYIRQVVSRDQFKWWPGRLCLDVQRRRLYVADNEWKDGKPTAGRVVVFSV